MTNSQAVNRLYAGWLVFTVVLGLLVAVQGVQGKYDTDWAIPAQWAFALVAPSLTLLGAARSNKGKVGKGKWGDQGVDISNYRMAWNMSLLIWVAGCAVFVWEVMGNKYIYDLIPIATVVLILLQTVVLRSVTSIAFANR